MKTYKRKNVLMAMAPIEGVLSLCRLCLEEAKHGVPIFSNKNDICSSLATQIMMCVGYEVTQEDCLPNTICAECHKELTDYYEFRKKCNKTYHRLKAHVFAVQTRSAIGFNENLEQQKSDLVDNINCPVGQSVCAASESASSVSESVGLPLSPLVSQSMVSSTDRLILSLDEITQIQFVHLDPELQNGLDINIINNNTLPNEAVLNKSVEESLQVLGQTQPTNVTLCPDVTEFLSSILVEMGILKKQPDDGQMSQQCRTVLIETGDNEQITLELLQIEEEKQTDTRKKIRKAAGKVKSDATKLHDDERPSCSVCSRKFSSRAVLARHARVHTGERPFRCAQCGRRFAQREVLRRHELVHREVRPFACAWCPKSFTQRSGLKVHARRHEAPGAPRTLHSCNTCPKVFLHASGLSRHMMSHLGRVYLCQLCPRRFSDNSSLWRHLRAKHKGVPPLAYVDTHTPAQTPQEI